MTWRSRVRALGTTAFVAGAACDGYACNWTDQPPPDPVQTHEPERRYATDDGAFEIVIHADDWPPVVGTNSLRIEWADAGRAAGPRLSIERPYTYDGRSVAAIAPVVIELRRGEWRVDDLELLHAGIWVVPVILERAEIDDSLALHLDVAAQ